MRLLALFAAIYFLSVGLAAARVQSEPLLLVSEHGGFSRIAPDQHRIAIYPDGTVYKRNVKGVISRDTAAKIAADVFQRTTRGSLSQCTEGLPTSTITVNRDGQRRSTAFYGLGSCTRRDPLARSILAAEDVPLKEASALKGPWIAYATLADGVPGSTSALKGKRLLPGQWRRVPARTPRLVRSGGHRYLLTPRALLPHERAGLAPGVIVAEVRRRARTGPRSLIGAPIMRVTPDRRWIGRNEDGRWATGLLTPGELARAIDGVDRTGFFAFKKNYSAKQLRFSERTTLKVFGKSRRSVSVVGLEKGVGLGLYPLALGRSAAILLALRPSSVGEYRPQAVRVRWQRTSRRSPVTMGKMPFRVKRRSGQTVLIGAKATMVWARYGSRTDAGVAQIGGRRYRLAIEPAF